jgi:hypothetical protein
MRRIQFLINSSKGGLCRDEVAKTASNLFRIKNNRVIKNEFLTSSENSPIKSPSSDIKDRNNDVSLKSDFFKNHNSVRKLKLSASNFKNMSKRNLLRLYVDHEGSKIHK